MPREDRPGETLKSDKDAAKALLRAFEGRMIQLDAADIAELITAAREEEREACALACEAYRDGDSWKTDELRRETHRLTAKWCAAMCRHPGYRQSGGCSGEARPEAGRDDAADWDPCRWCSAGIETVRHLPGGTCPRTGRTRPGRERATLLCHICRAHEAKIGGDCGLHPVTSAAWKAENEMLRYRGALREIVNGNYDGENARRCAEEALESSGDPKEVK